MTKPRRAWLRPLLKTLGTLFIALVCGLTTLAAFLPAAEDPVIPAHLQGGGARQNENAVNGLQNEWPSVPPCRCG